MAPTSASFDLKRPQGPLTITPPTQAAVVLSAFRSSAPGILGATLPGLILIALGWPENEPRPWMIVPEADLKAAEGRLKMYQAEMRDRGAKLPEHERAELRQDIQTAREAVKEAEQAVENARVTDIPRQDADRLRMAHRISDALMASGVPAGIVSNWAVQAVLWADKVASAGFDTWTELEEEGFTPPPAGSGSSGGPALPTATAEMPSAGSS